jgi:O-antigen/teichoic acid export membrane protein
LAGSQAVTVPLAVLVNAATARYLGPAPFGYLYLASTIAVFGALAVNWGHDGVLPALVAQDHSRSGALLGSSIAWRISAGIGVYAVLALCCYLLGYTAEMQWAVALSFLGSVLTSLVAACKDTVRGFERADIPAYAHVGQQFLYAAVLIPVLYFGGRIFSVLHVGNLTQVIVLVVMLRTLKPAGVGKLSVERSATRSLFVGGMPFVVFGLAMTLQPNVDAVFMSKLGSVEAIGWYAVARKLIGLLLFPATALIGALYPTLCRLWAEDQREFARVTRGSLHSVSLLVIPVALGCGLYPEIGVAIFSKKAFGPAADNLRVLAVFLFLVYFTMPIGTCVLACGKQRAWSAVQSICVVVSFALDPLLIPWFQNRFKNGGLGPSVASVVSELIVVACGLLLMPRGIIDKRLRRTWLMTLIAGGAMVGIASVLRSLSPFVAAPVTISAYGVVLWFTGEIDPSHVAAVKGVLQRKLLRKR